VLNLAPSGPVKVASPLARAAANICPRDDTVDALPGMPLGFAVTGAVVFCVLAGPVAALVRAAGLVVAAGLAAADLAGVIVRLIPLTANGLSLGNPVVPKLVLAGFVLGAAAEELTAFLRAAALSEDWRIASVAVKFLLPTFGAGADRLGALRASLRAAALAAYCSISSLAVSFLAAMIIYPVCCICDLHM
jgi:hypothetical protein